MEELLRFFYTLPCALRHKKYLKHVYSKHSLNKITDLKIEDLLESNIKGLVLDFDGVLSPHGYERPLDEVISWLDNIFELKKPPKVFILSNNPSLKRSEFFRREYPQVVFFVSNRKKPYPDGLHAICNSHSFEPEKVVMVDDRLLTGVLAAANAGTKALLIRKPFRDFYTTPLKESFFAVLRIIDKAYLI